MNARLKKSTWGYRVLTGDDPVGSDQDKLGRRPLAEEWARLLASASAPGGLVFAISGPWGSGKTSMLNMIRSELSSAGRKIVDFNPWLFSGTDQLVSYFFAEVASQIETDSRDEKRRNAAAALRKYGTLFSPLKAVPIIGSTVGAAAEAAEKVGKFIEETQQLDIHKKRTQAEEALGELDQPIFIALDDIDRLTGQEIRDILRMVRLTGAFKNVIYILAFDRQRVELALADEGLPGQAYLEKIVQVMLDVPLAPRRRLREILADELSALEDGFKDLRRQSDDFLDIYWEVIEPLITNMRDVRRYVGPLHATIAALGSKIEYADLLGLEAIRVFMPNAFHHLTASISALTATGASASRSAETNDVYKATIARLLKSEPGKEEILRAAIVRLFPAARRFLGENIHYGGDYEQLWLRDRRVASLPVFQYYLEHFTSDELLSAQLAETILPLLGNPEALETVLNSMPPRNTEDVIDALEIYEREFTAAIVVPACTVILDQENRLGRTRDGMLDVGPRGVIRRFTYSMLNLIPEGAERLNAVDAILQGLRTLTAKHNLINLIGHANGGRYLIDEDAWAQRRDTLREEVRSASPPDLSIEVELLQILWEAGPPNEESRWTVPVDHIGDPTFAARLALSSVDVARSQAMGSRAVKRTPLLAWDILHQVVGGEEILRQLRDSAAVNLGEKHQVIETFDKYLSGWRPRDFGR